MSFHNWAAGDQLNAVDVQQLQNSRAIAAIATETIAASAAVAVGLYQATPIQLDTKTIGILSSGAFSGSITVGSNSNRLLVLMVEVHGGNGPTVIAATFNGVAFIMSQNDTQLTDTTYCIAAAGYLVAPAAGTFTLAISGGGSVGTAKFSLYSIYNAAQSSPQDNVAYLVANSGTSLSMATTTEGAITFGMMYYSGGTPSGGGNVYIGDTQTATSVFAGDSGFANQYGAGTSMTLTGIGATGDATIALIAIKPFNAPVAGAQNASSASNNTRLTGFIGFANSSVTVGQTLYIIIGGLVTGFTGITTGALYYLNDTNGTIGQSPGSVSRKVGIGLNLTQLVFANEP